MLLIMQWQRLIETLLAQKGIEARAIVMIESQQHKGLPEFLVRTKINDWKDKVRRVPKIDPDATPRKMAQLAVRAYLKAHKQEAA